jgi:SAM-dependent methyltransferase
MTVDRISVKKVIESSDWCVNDELWQDVDALIFPPERISIAKDEVALLTQLLLTKHQRTSILDVGCGPGRHCIEFAKLGYSVVGVDSSPFLLNKAKAHAQQHGLRVDFQHRDMRKLNFKEQFDLAICLFSTFGYFQNQDENQQVLNNVFASLKPGGTFIVDIGSKETIARNFSPLQYFGSNDERSFLHRIVVDGWEFLEMRWYIFQNGTYKVYSTKVRIYSATEISAMLKQAGFSHIRVRGDFAGSPFNAEAKRLVVIAEKK